MESNKKDAAKRSEEVDRIMDQFLALGIALDHPGSQQFIKTSRAFTEEGVGASGTIAFDEYDRVMRYVLSTQAHVESRAVLEYVKKRPQAARGRGSKAPGPAPAEKRRAKPQRMCRPKPNLSVAADLVAVEKVVNV